MANEHSLISTIAVSLSFAFLGGTLANRLRLPPLIGYILAGLVVGPFTPGFVADQKLAPQLAEIGVILLMFGVGMHFSIKDLWAVRAVAIPGAVGQMAVATAMGLGAAMLWGWPIAAGFVFGLSLSVASTVVLLRALEARGLVKSTGGRIAIGWLVVEDLAMVLALVILPAFGPVPEGGVVVPIWQVIGITLLKVVLFTAIILVIGPKVFPWILQRIENTQSGELFILAVVALSLGVAYGSAELFGVSFALGAFFAGIVVHESDLSHKAAKQLQPLQDVFGALFFTSVGMLFDYRILLQQPLSVLMVVGIIVLGKSATAYGLVRLLRKPHGDALRISASLAQIGEFSFILAALGLKLELLPAVGQSLIVAGAILSIALNPLLFWGVEKHLSTFTRKST